MRISSGLRKQDEQTPRKLLRDTRTVSARIYEFFGQPRNTAIFTLFLACGAFVFPSVADFMFLAGIFVFIYGSNRKQILPFRLPMRSNLIDYSDLKEATSEPRRARGICFYGNEQETNKELWFNDTDMRTHTLIFGSTGSGKTGSLISFVYNALIQGSGFIYVDGKGDNTLFAQLFSLARSVGREDDVLIINFMTGARDIIGPQRNHVHDAITD